MYASMHTLKTQFQFVYKPMFLHADQKHILFRVSQMACLLSNYNKRLWGWSWTTDMMTMKVFCAGAVQPFWRTKNSYMSCMWVQTRTKPFHMAHASYT